MRRSRMRQIPDICLKVIFGITVAGVLAFGSCRSPSGKTEVRIGAVLPLTGEVANWGEDSSHAIDVAISRANQTSTKYSYRVLYEDSKGKASEAVAAAQKLVSIDKAPVIIGDNISGPTIAMLSVTS